MSTASDPSQMSFFDHLEELRSRLIRAILAVCICCVGCLFFSERIFDLLMEPVLRVLPPGDRALHFTGLIEPFVINLKVGLFAGLFVASPYIFYQIWAFVAPGLYSHEKRYVLPFLFAATFFFVGGAIFGYFIVFPAGFSYFLSFSSQVLRPMLTMEQYFSLSTGLMLVFGLVFEAPVIIFALALLGIVSPLVMLKHWRYVIVAISIISAILTPADVFTMIAMAIPLTVLYFGSALFAWLIVRQRSRRLEQELNG